MRYIKLILSLFGFCAFTNIWAQLSTNEKPVSFGREAELRVSQRSATPSVTMPQLDMVKINKEDSENDKVKAPARFGYTHIVNYNLNNSGTWYELSNGDKIWQLKITCPEAKSINLCYDKFWLPEGGKLIIDGGKLINANLDLKPGSTLRILNNGIIETRSGFSAPVGAKVEICYGRIL